MDWLATDLMPDAVLALAGLTVLGLGAGFRRAPRWLLLAVSLAGLCWAGLYAFVPGSSGLWTGAEGLSRCFTGLICATAGLGLLLMHRYAHERGFSGDALYGLVLWSSLGMLLTAQADNLMLLTVGVALMSLCQYALIASRRDDPLAVEAALKYFLPGAVALAAILVGVALVYAGTGEMGLTAAWSKHSATAGAGWALILVGIGFKLSLAPVHLWTPDVYQGAPAPVTAFLSTGSKAAVAAVILRLALTADAGPAPVLQAVAALTMVAGGVAALCQTSLKRLLAYSSISQMGYLAMAALAVRDGGERAGVFYLCVYVLAELGAFGAVGLLSGGEADRDAVADYRGLGFSHPWRAGLLALSLACLGGLPPTAGFVAKFAVFEAALHAGLTALAVCGVAVALASLYNCLRVVVVLYTPGEQGPATAVSPTGFAGGAAALAIDALLIGLGLFPAALMAALAFLLPG